MNEPVVKQSLTTDTERIAVALFGWQRDDSKNDNPKRDRVYSTFSHGHEHIACVHIDSGREMLKPLEWPDFAHARLRYYWVRRMEDALAARGLLPDYIRELYDIDPLHDEHLKNGMSITRGSVALRATTAQRVAAAIRVLDCIEAEAIKKAAQDDKSHARAVILLGKAEELTKTMQCNCDLDNWQPERSTGHSHVCRIHKAALRCLDGEGL